MESSSAEPLTRIVAWNVCGGGGKRVSQISTAIAALAPSIVVLSEITAKRVAEWRKALTTIGKLEYQCDAIESVTTNDPYTVLIASRNPFIPLPWTLPPPFPNRAVRVEIDGLAITGIHAPDQKVAGREFYNWLVASSASRLNTDAILLGDFNADELGDAMPLNRYFLPLIHSGWVNSSRHLRPDGDHTSWWSKSRGLAIDHCLMSPQLAPYLAKAEVLDSIAGLPTAGPQTRIAKGALSDHRPLLVDLLLRSAPLPTPQPSR